MTKIIGEVVMLLIIENVLSKVEVQQFRAHLEQANWESGSKSAGISSSHSKVRTGVATDGGGTDSGEWQAASNRMIAIIKGVLRNMA